MKIEPFQKKYFYDTIDYPSARAITDPIPLGVHYCYVATSYLDGFINYGEFVKAFVVGRYHDWFEDLNGVTPISINVSKQGYEWVKKSYKNKDEAFNLVTRLDAIIHPVLSQHFQDDVVILKKATDETGKVQWIYFWFDMDSSDSAIGRFETQDSDEIVIESFSKYVKDCSCNYHGEREIPLHYFRGWVCS